MEKLLKSTQDTEEKSNYRRQNWRRLKFGFNGTQRANCLEDFAHYNARLEELLDIDDLSGKKAVPSIYQEVSCQEGVVETLAACCKSSRNLRSGSMLSMQELAPCLSLSHHETNVERTNFSICFSYAATRVNDPCPWKRKETHAQNINQTTSHYHHRNLKSGLYGVTRSVL